MGNKPNRFLRRTLCLEYLSSGEKRAADRKCTTGYQEFGTAKTMTASKGWYRGQYLN